MSLPAAGVLETRHHRALLPPHADPMDVYGALCGAPTSRCSVYVPGVGFRLLRVYCVLLLHSSSEQYPVCLTGRLCRLYAHGQTASAADAVCPSIMRASAPAADVGCTAAAAVVVLAVGRARTSSWHMCTCAAAQREGHSCQL